MSAPPKVIVIGLDGATWDLLKPWADDGKLPTLKKLMNEGTWGKLESTTPPTTFPAWQSLFTGMNPGKLGVYDFVQVNIGQKKYRINSPESFHGRPHTIWKILSRFGYRSAIVNVPTAEVTRINGVMIGGAFSFRKPTYPHKFGQVLQKLGYEQYPNKLIKAFLRARKKSSILGPNQKIREIAESTFDSRFKVAKYILRKQKPHFLAFVIFSIDNIQHFFWGEEIVENLWQHLDNEIGDFLAELDENTYVILCSDHGFSKLRKTFYISKYLEEEHYLIFKKSYKQRTLNLIHSELLLTIADRLHLVDFLRKVINPEELSSIIGNFPDNQGRIGATGLERIIDWRSSKCIPLSAELYLNCTDNEKKQIVSDLCEKLERLEVHGEKLIDRVYTKEQIYSGQYIREAPDLVLKPKQGVRILESPFAKNMVEEGTTPRGWKGEHTPHGIFLATGPEIKRGKVVNAKIYDIASTILAIFNLPIPAEVDGSVLTEIFQQGAPNAIHI